MVLSPSDFEHWLQRLQGPASFILHQCNQLLSNPAIANEPFWRPLEAIHRSASALVSLSNTSPSIPLNESFVSDISFKLRTPITTICGHSGLILLQQGDQLDPQHHSMIQEIYETGEDLVRIVDELRDM